MVGRLYFLTQKELFQELQMLFKKQLTGQEVLEISPLLMFIQDLQVQLIILMMLLLFLQVDGRLFLDQLIESILMVASMQFKKQSIGLVIMELNQLLMFMQELLDLQLIFYQLNRLKVSMLGILFLQQKVMLKEGLLKLLIGLMVKVLNLL